jgi:hypothetical protein
MEIILGMPEKIIVKQEDEYFNEKHYDIHYNEYES